MSEIILPRMVRAESPVTSAAGSDRPMVCASSAAVEWIRAQASDGEEALRRFRIVAYTGGTMRVRGWPRPIAIDLSMLSGLDQQRPAVWGHDLDRIVGHTTASTIEGSNLVLEGVLSGVGAGRDAERVLALAKNGFPLQASVGVQASKVDRYPEGASVVVNGRQLAGPVDVVRGGVFFEISFLALGADDGTSVALAHAHTGDSTMDPFKQWLQAKGLEYDALSEADRTTYRAQYDRETQAGAINAGNPAPPAPAPTPTPAPAPAVINAANSATTTGTPLTLEAMQQVLAQNNAQVLAEAQRIADINSITANHPAVREQAVRERWDAARTRDAVDLATMRASRAFTLNGVGAGSHGSLPASTGNPGRPNPAAVLTASLCMAGGLSAAAIAASERQPDGFDQATLNAAMSREHRQATLSQLIYATIEAAGGYVRPGRIDDDTIRAALHADGQLAAQSAFIRASSGFSTISLSGILGNVANKQLLRSFLAVEIASSQFCGVGDNVDFKTTTRYRITGVGVLEEIGPTGEIKHTSLSEDGFPSRVKTHAKMITLTREMMINDDLAAFLQLPAILGRQASLAREYAVFRLLLSNPGSFFSTGNKNLLTGAGSALGIDGLSKARTAFRKQADKEGQPLMLVPKILLVPAALETYAEQLFTDTFVNETTTANTPKPASNPHKGRFRPVASPMLDANGFISGGSDTGWYLFADPDDVPAMRISYLRGQRQPMLDSAQTDFSTLGMQWRNVFDFGVDMEEPRAAQRNAGG